LKITSSKMEERDEKGLKTVDFWKINFIDNGIGFEEAYREKIFEIFQRLHTGEEYPGTGIGLAICKKIVENHHGEIVSKSVLGEGSTFSVILPTNYNLTINA
jgi:two-component system, chemotaxis family, sensor kinase Cph1